MIDSCDVNPDRLMEAFMGPLHRLDQLARTATMEQRTDQIRKDVTEARTCRPGVELKLNDARMLDDLEYLLERVDELVKRAEDGCEAGHKAYARGRADVSAGHGETIKKLTTQITNAMDALTAAGIKDVGGDPSTRLSRRIGELVDQRTSKANAMKLAVSNHDHSNERARVAEGVIDEAHRALSAAGIEKVFPLKRRIAILAKQELSKHNALVGANIGRESVNRDLAAATEIIAGVHTALDDAEVPKHEGVTLLGRLEPVLDDYARREALRTVVSTMDITQARMHNF